MATCATCSGRWTTSAPARSASARASSTQPIPVRRRDELGDLAEQVNTMARDIRGMLDAKRGLLLAVSHELRSPLTRARLNAELVAPGESRDALLRDLGTMRDLITDLLESERLAAGHAALQRERCDLNALVRALVAEQFATAALRLELAPQLPAADARPGAPAPALRNLIDNALRHGGAADTPPCVRTALADGQAGAERARLRPRRRRRRSWPT